MEHGLLLYVINFKCVKYPASHLEKNFTCCYLWGLLCLSSLNLTMTHCNIILICFPTQGCQNNININASLLQPAVYSVVLDVAAQVRHNATFQCFYFTIFEPFFESAEPKSHPVQVSNLVVQGGGQFTLQSYLNVSQGEFIIGSLSTASLESVSGGQCSIISDAALVSLGGPLKVSCGGIFGTSQIPTLISIPNMGPSLSSTAFKEAAHSQICPLLF
jgi:hypothetical protein